MLFGFMHVLLLFLFVQVFNMDKITESNFWMQKESKCCIIKCICVGRSQSSEKRAVLG